MTAEQRPPALGATAATLADGGHRRNPRSAHNGFGGNFRRPSAGERETAAIDPGYRASDSVFFTRVMEPLFMRAPGKTIHGMFTARADLAACVLAQLTENRYVHKAAGVVTTTGTPGLIQQIWREGITKEKR